MSIDVAFIIGCSKYDDNEIGDLQYPTEDALAIEKLVQSICGLPEDNVITFTSASDLRLKPTRNNIIRELAEPQRRKGKMPEIDRLYLFFSGHGMQSDEARDYLLPSDAVLTALEDSALDIDRIKHFVRSWRARINVFLVDACRAAISGAKSVNGLPPIATSSLRVPGFATIWSCSPTERSYESEFCKRGIFAYTLEQAFTSGRCATVYELDSYLKTELPRFSARFERPCQSPFSSVEPIEIKDTLIVSQATLNGWQTGLPIGSEIRTGNSVPRAESHNPPVEVICAIDFGTSFCLATILGQDKVQFVPDSDGRTHPSAVTFFPSKDFVVGHRALEHAHDPRTCCVTAIKRKLGSTEVVTVAGIAMSPEVVSSLILRSLKRNVEDFTGRNVLSAIVAAPANFTIRQCNALLRAFELAGIPIIRVYSEPSAASVVLSRYVSGQSYTMAFVLDLGGGALDVSVVELGEGVCEVVALSGDSELGGLDYEHRMAAPP
jgi:molecular chaperone DnaK